MNLLYCGDKNISAGLILSVLSVINHNPEPVNIYVLTMSLSTGEKVYEPVSGETISLIDREIKKRNPESSITCIDAGELFDEELGRANLETRFTPYCMLRLFADIIDEIPDKILYLDTDVLCRGSLRDFYEQDLEGIQYAAVLDHYGSWFFRKKDLKRSYCNSGVLLLNMKMIRETGLFTDCRRLIAGKKMFFPDQTALNRLAVSVRLADSKYNEQRRLHKDTVLQHFATSFRLFPVLHTITVKPWEFDRVHSKLKNYEYDGLFDEYRALMNNR